MTILIAYTTKDSCWFACDGLISGDNGYIFSKNTCKIVLPITLDFECVFGVSGGLDVLSILRCKTSMFCSIDNINMFIECLSDTVSDNSAIRSYEGYKGFNILVSFRDNPSVVYDIDESKGIITTSKGYSFIGSGTPYVKGFVTGLKKQPNGYKLITQHLLKLLDVAKECDIFCGGTSFLFKMDENGLTNYTIQQ